MKGCSLLAIVNYFFIGLWREKQGELVSVCIMSLNGPQSLPTDKKCQQLNQEAFKNSILDETGNLGVC